MNYYRLHDKNSDYPDRWYLGSPLTEDGQELDPRMFTTGEAVKGLGPLRVPVTRDGSPQEFTMADFDMPVLAASFVEELKRVAPGDFQAIPVTVSGADEHYSIVNILRVVECLDESRSSIARWPVNSPIPELAGTYLTVSDIHIDSACVKGEQIFRVKGWLPAIIVSEGVGSVLADATGAVLERV